MTAPHGLCVVGSFMMDLIAYAPRRPSTGETLIGTDFIQSPGGKGFNQAIAGARSGAGTSMVGCVGADSFGDEFVAVLSREGVDPSGVVRRPDVGTGVGLPVVSADGDNSIIVIPRANRALTQDDLHEVASAIRRASVVLLQLELSLDVTIEAARIAHETGAMVILNPAPFASLPDEVFEHVDILVPNETEAAAWLGLPEAGDPTERLARVRQHADAQGMTVLLTLGAEGACVVEPGREPLAVPAHRVEVVDTIGAGDTFCGYLAGRLAQGATLYDAVREATAAAALAVTRRGGASCPSRDEVDAFMAERAAGGSASAMAT